MKTPFLTPSLMRQLPLAVISGLVIAASGFFSTSVHIPFLINILCSAGLGWLQPQKGWLLALVQLGAIIGGYFLIHAGELLPTDQPDVARFAMYLAAIPTFAGSFMGGFLKRAFLKEK
ncbi:hypothetical protein [Arundinibacter roseus]|uniref:Uncharacterized protein n=1 Tax=Arundinibacter roseus TaxID=2070510 RepID=A0A4R4KA13_9BACT|nr:hypothetical protein [Arundinibacter roseus]TDB63492.1 hypothetical protein EZE20_17200 [Arundinibacter roseus]